MESAILGAGGGQLLQPSVPVLLDDASRLRVLHPDLYANSRVVEKTCNTFRSKLQQFHNIVIYDGDKDACRDLNKSYCSFDEDLVKNLLFHADEQSQRIETAKSQALGTRNLMSAEVETRSEVMRDQKNIIADRQEQLEKLNAEFKSLVTVKQEQEVLIAHLSESSLPGL